MNRGGVMIAESLRKNRGSQSIGSNILSGPSVEAARRHLGDILETLMHQERSWRSLQKKCLKLVCFTAYMKPRHVIYSQLAD